MSYLILVFLATLVVFMASIYFWNGYVENAKYANIRKYLLLVLCGITALEVYAWKTGAVRPHFLPVVLVVNLWGYLDAVYRFPAVPQLESFFCLKLIVCVISKTVIYSIGFIDIHKWALLFLSALFLNVWLLPILYVLIVPYGDSSPFRADRDILVQFFLYLVDSQERQLVFREVCEFYRSSRRKLRDTIWPMAISVEKNWL